MDRTVPHILDTIERMRKVTNFLPQDNEVGPFIKPGNIILEIDDVGLIAICPVDDEVCHCHITFWDRRLRGREAMCRTIASWAVALTGKILATGIPDTSPAVLMFAKRIGFVERARIEGIVILTFSNYPE